MNKEQDIILVNDRDEVVGYGEKMEVHRKNLQHRAFSIFIYDRETRRMLLQKRASGKYHSGGLWTNACCSHPRRDEALENCLSTRLREELGINAKLHIVKSSECDSQFEDAEMIHYCGKFAYSSSFGEMYENEIDYVYLYISSHMEWNITVDTCNPEEIEDIKWISMKDLKYWIRSEPEAFTVWFKPAFSLAYRVLCSQETGEPI